MPGSYSYKLVQIDYDGTRNESEIVEVDVGGLLTEYALMQNFPNPFNPTTTITWQSPLSGHQTLKVYDVLGREMATLVNDEMPAGTYELNFDAVELPSGFYFYTLTAGSFTDTKKMILLK